MIGTIKEGVKANIYAKPDPDAMIICQLNGGTRVEVDARQDLGKFYIVCTSMGVEGFCMKKYIAIER